MINDPYLWLEDVTGERALAWVSGRNRESTGVLTGSDRFEAMRRRFLEILNSDQRVPRVTKYGPHLYNFWRDAAHPRGLLRRTTPASYRELEPAWEIVLDLDRLAEAEAENWVWGGYQVLRPSFDRALVMLSRGGGDAHVVREYDLVEKGVVPDGFFVPEAKTGVSWRDRDRVFVATDFGPGSLSASGYPLVVKSWQRGTPLSEAETVFRANPEDMSAAGTTVHDRGRVYEYVSRRMSFRTSETFLLRDGERVRIEKPADADVNTFGDWLLLTLRLAWTVNGRTYPAGALVAAPFDAYLAGSRALDVLYEPAPDRALVAVTGTRQYLVLNELENVRTRLYRVRHAEGAWEREPMAAPPLATVRAWGVERNESDAYWMTRSDFLSPSSLWLGGMDGAEPERLKSSPAFFRADGLCITQEVAVSRDGTRVPYFLVAREGLVRNGSHPTLLLGYGGFEVPLLSDYMAVTGAGWLEGGGVFAMANIRGGGEFGPDWHQQALRENRQRAYDDFAAVAEDLIRRKITSPKHLGIRGGSNGGLLVGNLLVQRPELFGAVVCQVPLLDMKRYHLLLAGASWIEEFGDPDRPEDWAFLQGYSPYHRVRPDVDYPPVLLLTSTRDDRVHPAHARKLAARMQEQGHRVLYYENTEGGHGAAANNEQQAFMEAMIYTFLWDALESGLGPGNRP